MLRSQKDGSYNPARGDSIKRFQDSPFAPQLEVVASIANAQIEASLAELKKHDELTLALRDYLRQGVSIDELSEATGLSPGEIRRRTTSELVILSDLDSISGVR